MSLVSRDSSRRDRYREERAGVNGLLGAMRVRWMMRHVAKRLRLGDCGEVVERFRLKVCWKFGFFIFDICVYGCM